MAVVAMVTVACSGGLDIETDHEAIGQAPEPLSAVGPQPGRFEESWQVTVEEDPAGFHVISGQLVVATESGVQAYDARTGEPTWHYREPGRELQALTGSDGVIVLESARIEDNEEGEPSFVADKHHVGLDAGTGELLWENDDEWSLTVRGHLSGSPRQELGDVAAGVVVGAGSFPAERVGVDVQTGDELWRISDEDIAGTCSAQTGDSGDDEVDALVLVVMSCRSADNVAIVLDAPSGELRWRRPLADLDGAPTMRSGVTAFIGSGVDRPVLIGPDGEDLYRPEGEVDCACELYSTGDHLVFRYYDRTRDRDRLVRVDPDSGASTTLPDWPDVMGTRFPDATTERALYTVANTRTLLLPWTIGVMNVTTGDVTVAPLPVSTAEPTHPTWLGAAGERLFVARTRTTQGTDPAASTVVTSYTVAATDGPVELGGVSPGDWPEPCGLLSGVPQDRGKYAPAGIANRGEPVRIGSVTIPRTSCTTWLPDVDTATVEVAWVAASDEDAAELSGDGDLDVAGADDAWQTSAVSAVLRVDRTIVSVTYGPDTPEPMRQTVLETVAANLRPGV